MDCEKVYQEFMSFCSQALAKEDPKFLEMIKIKYKACREDFRNSEAMVALLKETQSNMEKEKSRKFVHLKDLLTEFKAQSVKKIKRDHKRQLSEDSDSEIQPHKSVKLMTCCVLLEKADEEETHTQLLEDYIPEKKKVCLISSGIPDSVQEINVATNEQQVSLFKEFGDSQNNCSIASPCHDSQSLHSPHKTSIVDNSDTDCAASLRSPSRIEHYKHYKRKSTTIVNIDFAKSPEIQKISVSPHLTSRHSTLSRAKSNDLATGSTEDKNSDGINLGNKYDKAGPSLESCASGCAGSPLKVGSSAIFSSEAQNETFNYSTSDCDEIAKHCNYDKCTDEGLSLDVALLEKEEMTEDIPLVDVDVTSASVGVSDSAENTHSKHLCGEKVEEKTMTKEVKVLLTDCQQLSPRPPKRALFKTLDKDDHVTNRFSLAQGTETRNRSKSKLFESESLDCSQDFQEPKNPQNLEEPKNPQDFEEPKKPQNFEELKNPPDFEEPKNPTEAAKNSKYKRHVKKLENLLESLQNEIEKCQNQELSLDNLEDETSAYIYEDKLKKKFVAAWNKLCEITKRSVSTGRPTERTIKYEGTRYKEVNRRLERFLNKRKIFPDFTDIKNIIKLTNKKYKLNLNSSSIDTISREAFVDIGEMLQTRRHQDFIATFGNRHTDYICSDAHDPYMTDPELRKKLDKNRKIARSSLDEVIAKFSKLQDERKDHDNDDEEEEDDDKDIEEEKNKVKTKRKICSEEEDESDDEKMVPAETSDKSEIPNATLETIKTRYDLQLNDNVLSERGDQSLKSGTTTEPLTSFVKALGLNPLTLGKADNLSRSDPSATPESVIVIEESPRKSDTEISAQLKVHCGHEKGEDEIYSAGLSTQNPILLKGPNLKFTARKSFKGRVKLSPTGSEISLSKSYDDIALENEEDEEDQSSESDNVRSDDDDDDDIMIIAESLSEADTVSSREPSPVSVISLGSSIDDADDVGTAADFQCKLSPSIKQEPKSASGRLLDSCASSMQRTSMSESLDLASSSSCKDKLKKDSCPAQENSSLSTDFLDLAIRKTKSTTTVSTIEDNSSSPFFSPLILSSCSYGSLVGGGESFKPIEWNEGDMNDADVELPDKVEITIDVDDECYESGLLIAAENDSYIIHQTLSKNNGKSVQECGATTDNSSTSLQSDNVDSVINIDEFSNDIEVQEQKSKPRPKELSPVIVIDEASQEVGVQAKGMAATETANSDYFHGLKENILEPCSLLDNECELINEKIEEICDNQTIIQAEKSVLVTDCQNQSEKSVVLEASQVNSETVSETSDCLIIDSQPDEKTIDSVKECDKESTLVPEVCTEVRNLDDTNASNPHSDSRNSPIDSQKEPLNMNDTTKAINSTPSPEAQVDSIASDVSYVQMSQDINSAPDVVSGELLDDGKSSLNPVEIEQYGNNAIAGVTDKLMPQLNVGASSKPDCSITEEQKESTLESRHELLKVNVQSTEDSVVSNEDVMNKEPMLDETVGITREGVDEPVNKDDVQTSLDLQSEEIKAVNKDDVQASADLRSEEDKTVNKDDVQASADLRSEEDKTLNKDDVQASTDLRSEEDKTLNKDDVQASTNLRSEEDKNKPSSVESKDDCCDEEDVFKSIFRLCDEMIQNSEPKENNNACEEKASNSDLSNSCSAANELSKEVNEDKSIEQPLLEPPTIMEDTVLQISTSLINEGGDETVTANVSPAQSASTNVAERSNCSEGTSKLVVSDTGTDSAEKDCSLPGEQKSNNCEDEVEIIEELSNAKGQRQCLRTKEEDRLWISQQLDKISSCGANPTDKSPSDNANSESSEQPKDTESAVEQDEDGKPTEPLVSGSETMPDLDMEVECVDNETSVSCLNEQATTSNGKGVGEKDGSGLKRKRENLVSEKLDTSKSSAVEKPDLVRAEPDAKKKHVDADFITELISSVYNGILVDSKPKKPPAAQTCDEDEDVLVVEAHFKPKTKTVTRPGQPCLPRNRITNIPSPVRNFSNASSTFARTNQRSTLHTASTSTSNTKHQNPMARALPSLNPRVPIPSIQSPTAFGNPRYPTKPFQFQYNLQRKPLTNSSYRPYIPKHVARTGLTSPYFKGIPSPSAPSNSFRPSLAIQRSQRPLLGAHPQTRQTGRPAQQAPVNNTRQLARNLNNTEIVLDDSDSEDQRTGPSVTPVILSVTSLSSAAAPATAKKANVKKPGDIIVLSDSD